jgi:hypothetical protein
MEAGDLGGRDGPVLVDGVVKLEKPGCDRMEMVVAVDAEEETRVMSTGSGEGMLVVDDDG